MKFLVQGFSAMPNSMELTVGSKVQRSMVKLVKSEVPTYLWNELYVCKHAKKNMHAASSSRMSAVSILLLTKNVLYL